MSRRTTVGSFVALGLAVCLALALFVSPRASSSPDGLERVAEDEGFIDTADDHALADSPLADYAVRGVDHAAIGTGLSGVVGVAVTFAIAAGLAWAAARVLGRRPAATAAATSRPTAGPTATGGSATDAPAG